jgi:DUF1365 family protein
VAISLILGRVMHKRLLPKANGFNYQSTYIAFSLKEKSLLKNRLFGVNQKNLFAFFDRDHGDGSNDCAAWIENILQQVNFPKVADIILVSHPRIANYVFNPASFWLCFDEQKKLIGVLVEVNNTFKQRHSYLLYNENFSEILPNQWFDAQKMFHVSPFFPVDGNYKFRFVIAQNKMDFYINYYRQNQLQLCTYLKCDLQNFCVKNLVVSFLKIPFATFKTIALIHFQALKLFAKKIKFHQLNSKPKTNFSAYQNVKK